MGTLRHRARGGGVATGSWPGCPAHAADRPARRRWSLFRPLIGLAGGTDGQGTGRARSFGIRGGTSGYEAGSQRSSGPVAGRTAGEPDLSGRLAPRRDERLRSRGTGSRRSFGPRGGTPSRGAGSRRSLGPRGGTPERRRRTGRARPSPDRSPPECQASASVFAWPTQSSRLIWPGLVLHRSPISAMSSSLHSAIWA